jgi:hypothetical protein
VCVCVCVCSCARVCVRACVCVCARACVFEGAGVSERCWHTLVRVPAHTASLARHHKSNYLQLATRMVRVDRTSHVAATNTWALLCSAHDGTTVATAQCQNIPRVPRPKGSPQQTLLHFPKRMFSPTLLALRVNAINCSAAGFFAAVDVPVSMS